jgi:alpha-mannosidase
MEVACNGMFGNGNGKNYEFIKVGGMIDPPSTDRYYRLNTVELAVPNQDAQKLWVDFSILKQICREMSDETQIFADAIYTANRIVNTVIIDKPRYMSCFIYSSTVKEGLAISTEFFQKRAKYGYADHEITATGHCHIDTAWLWPYDETKRKAARSWATQCGLMDMYPEYKFSCSVSC